MINMISVKSIKQVVLDAVISFTFWTGILTPYMLLIVRMDVNQYIAWVIMQGFLVPPLGVVYSRIVRKIRLK